jgi:hypothetical protein
VVKFGREAFRQYATRRAPGASRAMIRTGYTSEPVALHQEALDGLVPVEHQEEAQAVPGIDLRQRATNVVLDAIRLEEEIQQATLAQDEGNYGAQTDALSGTDQWSDSDSDPGAQMDDAHESIRAKTGRRGNVLVLGPGVLLAARRHPKIVGHYYTGVANGVQTVTDEQIAAYFRVRKVVAGDAVFLPAGAADDADFSDVWGNVAILAYVPENDGEGSYEVPSYGYTYYLNGYPMVRGAWWDADVDSWRIPVTDEFAPVHTGMGAGYLLTDVLAS